MKSILQYTLFFLCCIISIPCNSQVIMVQKNEAYELAFPMIDSASWAAVKTGVSPVDDGYYKDGAGSWTALAITDTAAEIASTGLYQISLTAAEMNHDWIIVKFSVGLAATTTFVFKTYANDIDANLSVGTLANNTITAAAIATDAFTSDEFAATAITELQAGLSTHSATDVWAVGTRTLTALDEDGTTIDLNGSTVGGLTTWDKAGYSISGTVTTLDALNTDLSSVHGSGTWGTGTVPSATDIWAFTTRTLTALDEDSTTLDLNATYTGGITTFDEDTTTIDINGTTIGTASTVTNGVTVTTNNDKTGYALAANAVDATALSTTALVEFLTVDTGQTTAVAGSVGKIAQGSAGGNVTVEAFTNAALDQFATDDTGLTTSSSGSVAWLAGKCGLVSHTYTVYSPGGTTVSGAAVFATSDSAGLNYLDAKRTNGSGVCTLQVPAGTIYLWSYHPSHSFTNPDSEVAN